MSQAFVHAARRHKDFLGRSTSQEFSSRTAMDKLELLCERFSLSEEEFLAVNYRDTAVTSRSLFPSEHPFADDLELTKVFNYMRGEVLGVKRFINSLDEKPATHQKRVELPEKVKNLAAKSANFDKIADKLLDARQSMLNCIPGKQHAAVPVKESLGCVDMLIELSTLFSQAGQELRQTLDQAKTLPVAIHVPEIPVNIESLPPLHRLDYLITHYVNSYRQELLILNPLIKNPQGEIVAQQGRMLPAGHPLAGCEALDKYMRLNNQCMAEIVTLSEALDDRKKLFQHPHNLRKLANALQQLPSTFEQLEYVLDKSMTFMNVENAEESPPLLRMHGFLKTQLVIFEQAVKAGKEITASLSAQSPIR